MSIYSKYVQLVIASCNVFMKKAIVKLNLNSSTMKNKNMHMCFL